MPSHDPFSPASNAKPPSSAPADSPESEVPAIATPEAPGEALSQPESAASELPRGTTKELLEWVGDDLERAQALLDAELEAEQPRKGLLNELQGLINGDDAE